jgi:hypothetical protein
MANWYCSSVDYTAVAQFAISTAYTLGQIVRQLATPAIGSERCFRCTTPGTSGGTEATWTLTKGSTTTQGTAVFTEITGNETYQSPGAWAAPHKLLSSALNTNWIASGDTVYVAANHAESTAAAQTIGNQGASYIASVICVDNSGSGHVPPTASDTRTTASVTTTGNNELSVQAHDFYSYGINFFSCSGGSGSFNLNLNGGGTAPCWQRFEACSFKLGASNGAVLIGSSSMSATVEWVNSSLITTSAANAITLKSGRFTWRNTANAVTGTALQNVLSDSVPGGGTCLLDGLDLSNLAHTAIVSPNMSTASNSSIVNCKINASTIIGRNSSLSYPAPIIDNIGCDSGGATYRNERFTYTGALTTEIAVVHTGGASDGTTAISWKLVSTANAGALRHPFEAFPIAQWNAATGAAKTVSFEAIANAAALLTNAQLWMDVAYLGTAGATLATIDTTGAAPLAATSTLTASTQAWDSLAAARANSHANVVGDAIKVSSNSDRVFFCTTGGTTSGSLPAGYASAVDGGSVTDGTAVFRAGVRMTVSLSITPQVAGLIRVVPKIGIASATLYIDPLLSIV